MGATRFSLPCYGKAGDGLAFVAGQSGADGQNDSNVKGLQKTRLGLASGMNQITPTKIQALINNIERCGVRARTQEQAMSSAAHLLQQLDDGAALVSVQRFSPGISVGITFRHESTGTDEWQASAPCLSMLS